MRSAFIAAVAALLLSTGTLCAQPRRPMPRPAPKTGAVIERLNRMTPEERQRALDRLPANRRARVEERLNRLNSLTPEQRERLRGQYEEFQKLAPEKQEAARRAFRDLNQLPMDRKRAVRRAVMRVRNMTPQERNSTIESDTFRSRFSDSERQIVRDLAETPPPAAPDTSKE